MEINHTISNSNICSLCNVKHLFLVECRNCSNHFCYTTDCGIHFDHTNNSVYSICNNCVNNINEKMKISIDYTLLESLKKKIELRKMIQR